MDNVSGPYFIVFVCVNQSLFFSIDHFPVPGPPQVNAVSMAWTLFQPERPVMSWTNILIRMNGCNKMRGMCSTFVISVQ